MDTECNEQFTLKFPKSKEVRGQFDGGRLSTDTGLAVLREHESRRTPFERASDHLNDSRQQSKVQHLQSEVLRQRCYGIIAGYEDAADHDELADDPVFQMLDEEFEGVQEDRGASQSTVSRMENDITARSVVKLNEWLLEDFIDRNQDDPPEEVVLEIDPTADPTHGNQQLTMFDGFYGQSMYFPLFVFDGESGDCLCARLRPGNADDKDKAQVHLRRIIRRLKEAFSGIRITLRADAGFMDPALYRMLENEDVSWAINLSKNAILKDQTEDMLKQVKQEYEQQNPPEDSTPEMVTRYISLTYQADSWTCERRVCAKIQYGPRGANRRFVVTTLSEQESCAREVFEFYEARGQCENYIKELKNGLFVDRLSCTDYVANAFRLLEHVMAYNVLNDFRNTVLEGTDLETADVHTLRQKLFKVAARIRVTARRIWLHLSESWPFREELLQSVQAVARAPG